jgi:catechol 2,3-dioxygenase-like lactoylglutathione lyase family enzyme
MKPKISLVTLGASDLNRSIQFYKDGLGFPIRPRKETDDVAFFGLDGTWLSLYPKTKLAEDAMIPADGNGFGGITLAHNVATKAEVDEVVQLAVAAGAKLVKQPQEVFWGGYSGYFADPDGYLWEVAYNPYMDLT